MWPPSRRTNWCSHFFGRVPACQNFVPPSDVYLLEISIAAPLSGGMPNYEAGHVIDDVHAWQQLIIWPIVAPAPTLFESTLPPYTVGQNFFWSHVWIFIRVQNYEFYFWEFFVFNMTFFKHLWNHIGIKFGYDLRKWSAPMCHPPYYANAWQKQWLLNIFMLHLIELLAPFI